MFLIEFLAALATTFPAGDLGEEILSTSDLCAVEQIGGQEPTGNSKGGFEDRGGRNVADGQLALDTCLVEGLDNEVRVRALTDNRGTGGQGDVDLHSFGGQRVIAVRGPLSLGLDAHRHLTSQHVDGAGAEHAQGIALVTDFGCDREDHGIQGPSRDEHVSDDVAAARPWYVMALSTGV